MSEVGRGLLDHVAGEAPVRGQAHIGGYPQRGEVLGSGLLGHGRSLAAGLLDEGDVVLEVDGVSLEHVDPSVLAERMVGLVGPLGPHAVLAGLFILAAVASQVFSGTPACFMKSLSC